MEEVREIMDITIVGGGPAGLFAAFYGGMRQASVKIIESMPQLGGQLAALYPEKYVYDVAGFPKIKAQELVNNLVEQAMMFKPTICLGEKVLKITKDETSGIFTLTTDKGEHASRAVIIAAGVGAFEPRRLTVPGTERFEGKNLHYFMKHLDQFKGQRVAVLGGGDSAVDWALMLEPIASEVHLIHRRDTFRAHEASVVKLQNSPVKIWTPYEVKAVEGTEQIETVVIQKGEETTVIPVDAVIVSYGFVSSLGPIQDWGLMLEKGSIVVNSRMETNIPGIYAIGDINTYEGKIKLIAVGLGEAPTAVNNAKNYIDPTVRVQPQHSSSMTFA